MKQMLKKCYSCTNLVTPIINKKGKKIGWSTGWYAKRCLTCRLKIRENSKANTKCNKCGIYKNTFIKFSLKKSTRKRFKICKECISIYQKLYRQKHA